MKRFVCLLLMLLPLASCQQLNDPYAYKGYYGIRMNINGDKYVLRDSFSTRYTVYDSAYHLIVNGNFAGIINDALETYNLSFNLSTPSQLHAGEEYVLDASAAQLKYNADDSDPVPLSGWIRIITLDFDAGRLEAQFELSSAQYTVKHGFLRMHI